MNVYQRLALVKGDFLYAVDKLFQGVVDLVVEIYRKKPSNYSLRSALEHAAIRAYIQESHSTCDHLKGGPPKSLRHLDLKYRSGYKSRATDYNLSMHRFIDGHYEIRCLKCRKIWLRNDPDWRFAVKMMDQSTNWMSSSETPAPYFATTERI